MTESRSSSTEPGSGEFGESAGGTPRAPRSGRAREDVPWEDPLARVFRVILGVESLVLAAVGVAGLVVGAGDGFFGRAPDIVLALRLNQAHSVLLLVTGLAVGAAVFGSRAALRRVVVVQTVVYTLLAVFGTAFSVGGGPTVLDLNGPDHILHTIVALVGFSSAYVLAAHILEPGATSPPPYPTGEGS